MEAGHGRPEYSGPGPTAPPMRAAMPWTPDVASWHVACGMWHGPCGMGLAWPARANTLHGACGMGMARHGMGMARRGAAWHGHGMGMARRGMAWHGHGMAWAWHGIQHMGSTLHAACPPSFQAPGVTTPPTCHPPATSKARRTKPPRRPGWRGRARRQRPLLGVLGGSSGSSGNRGCCCELRLRLMQRWRRGSAFVAAVIHSPAALPTLPSSLRQAGVDRTQNHARPYCPPARRGPPEQRAELFLDDLAAAPAS